MDATVIVGANYGDEGKGLATDYFSHLYVEENKKVLNVLHNGGAQRAHTVELPDGTRHVFHHVGSGSLAGADTYITGEFIVNPIELRLELNSLELLKCRPKVYIDDHLTVSTPYDMMANQIMEERRKFDEKLGTCGMGIWESIVRNNYIPLKIRDLIIAIYSKEGFFDHLRPILKRICNYYINDRMRNITIGDNWLELYESEEMLENFLKDCFLMLMDKRIFFPPYMHSKPQPIWTPYKDYDHVIFENGQGLLLDTHIKEGMEYNTPSNTTLLNPVVLLQKWYVTSSTKVDRLDMLFVTRTYVTRHGRGKLPDEIDVSYLECERRIFDKTNIPNQWQGALRYAPIEYYATGDIFVDLDARIREAVINSDIKRMKFYDKSFCSLFITHADELYPGEALEYILPHRLSYNSDKPLPFRNFYVSEGPTRNTVGKYEYWEEYEG